MPQLDLTTFASQIFWLILSFCVLYYVMAKLALPMVRETLQNRQVRIANDLKRAEKLKQEAESAYADFTSTLEQAKQAAHRTLLEARSQAEEKAKQKHIRLDETFEKQQQEAEQRYALLRKESTDKMSEVSLEIAQTMIEKLLHTTIDIQTIRKTVEQTSH